MNTFTIAETDAINAKRAALSVARTELAALNAEWAAKVEVSQRAAVATFRAARRAHMCKGECQPCKRHSGL